MAKGEWRKGKQLKVGTLSPFSFPHSLVFMRVFQTIAMLTVANCFMTFAWYGHLRTLSDRPWWIAALLSWLVAFFEYMLQVPANRIGFTVLTLPQLKMMQEVITLVVFVPFAVFFMRQRVTWDYAWAGLCVLGAVYFVFRAKG